MNKVIFREYDIRGVVGKDFLIDETPSLVHAIMWLMQEQNIASPLVIVARDGRPSSPEISRIVIDTLQQGGFSVIDIGITPSPVAYFAGHHYRAGAVIMITASHNPVEYNGIKIVINNKAMWGEHIRNIYQWYIEKKVLPLSKKGTYQVVDMITPYVNYLYQHFPDLHGIALPIVFDCAYATAATVIPVLVKKFDWKSVIILHDVVGGDHSYKADPVVIANMNAVQKSIVAHDLSYGIGFDGDADRMCVMTDQGRLLSGDNLLALFMGHMKKYYSIFTVICNVTMSQSLFDYAKQIGVILKMVPTGHAIIETKMREFQALLGGESSCHFFFKDSYFGYDDGIYAALRFIHLMHASQKKIEALLEEIPSYVLSKEYRIVCPDDMKHHIVQKLITRCRQEDIQIMIIDGVRMQFSKGWAIVRAANTQPALSIRFEGLTKDDLLVIKRRVIAMLKTCTDIIDERVLLED